MRGCTPEKPSGATIRTSSPAARRRPIGCGSRTTRACSPATTAHARGETVRELVDALELRHPGFRSYVVDETGHLRRHVNVFVGEEPIRDRERLSDALKPDDK